MFKIPVSVLEECREAILKSNRILKGNNYSQKRLDSVIKSNEKIVKLLKDNYGI